VIPSFSEGRGREAAEQSLSLRQITHRPSEAIIAPRRKYVSRGFAENPADTLMQAILSPRMNFLLGQPIAFELRCAYQA
jgi:hypothetical protein